MNDKDFSFETRFLIEGDSVRIVDQAGTAIHVSIVSLIQFVLDLPIEIVASNGRFNSLTNTITLESN